MLTVKEINEISFGKARFSGYKPEDVDSFIDKVAESFQELLGERDAAVKQAEGLAALNTELAAKNADSQKKLSILAQKVEKYRQEEEGIKDAIISSQRMSRELMREAQEQSDRLIQDAKLKADNRLREADEEARRIAANAEEDAAKAAREYVRQVDMKKNELEDVKRQVNAFRTSLLEMYKKHLECIDHIPVFRQKDGYPEPAGIFSGSEPEAARYSEPAVPSKAPEPEPEPPARPRRPEPEPEPEPERAPLARKAEQEVSRVEKEQPGPAFEIESTAPAGGSREEDQPVRERRRPQQNPEILTQSQYAQSPEILTQARRQQGEILTQPQQAQQPEILTQPQQAPPQPVRRQRQNAAPTLNDRVNYVQEQLPSSQLPSDYMDDDLSSVGIDLNAYNNIPESLRREKSENYRNLEFGEGVDVTGRKHKR